MILCLKNLLGGITILSIACCEDDSLTLDLLLDILNEYAAKNHIVLDIDTFASGAQLLNSLPSEKVYDIFILDYYMPFVNGVDVAKKLRAQGEEGIIIFSTSSMDGVIDAFEVNAFRYLLKPLNQDVICNALDLAIEEIDKKHPISYEIRTVDGIKKVKDSDIVYIEKANRSLRYHFYDNSYIDSVSIRSSVKNAVQDLIDKDNFVMVGPSLTINMKQIESIAKGSIFFKNGVEITPPRREYSTIKSMWA